MGHKKHNNSKRHKTICYTGFGSIHKSGNHSAKQFRKTMRKHHLYDCLDKMCAETKSRKVCALTRKCTRRNKRKRKFTAKQWVKWTGASYGRC
jgi:hypothetical protein